MSVPGVRRKAALSSGCKSHPATTPSGSNRASVGIHGECEGGAITLPHDVGNRRLRHHVGYPSDGSTLSKSAAPRRKRRLQCPSFSIARYRVVVSVSGNLSAKGARAHRLAIEMNSARTTCGDAATIFGAGQAELLPDRPKQQRIGSASVLTAAPFIGRQSPSFSFRQNRTLPG
jgi:hypothetical protein